jgi:hypothetical protein
MQGCGPELNVSKQTGIICEISKFFKLWNFLRTMVRVMLIYCGERIAQLGGG